MDHMACSGSSKRRVETGGLGTSDVGIQTLEQVALSEASVVVVAVSNYSSSIDIGGGSLSEEAGVSQEKQMLVCFSASPSLMIK